MFTPPDRNGWLSMRRTAAGAIAILLSAAAATHARAQLADAPVRDGERIFSRRVVSWQDQKFRHVIRQQRDYSCGAAALATVLRYHWGDPVTEWAVLRTTEKILQPEELADRVQNGLTLTDLRLTAVEMKYDAVIGRLELRELYDAKVPLVVAIQLPGGYQHFVVLRGIVGEHAYLADPFRGNLRIPVEQFADQWIENAVLVVAKPGQTESAVSQLGVRREEIDPHWLNYQHVRTRLGKAS